MVKSETNLELVLKHEKVNTAGTDENLLRLVPVPECYFWS